MKIDNPYHNPFVTTKHTATTLPRTIFFATRNTQPLPRHFSLFPTSPRHCCTFALETLRYSRSGYLKQI